MRKLKGPNVLPQGFHGVANSSHVHVASVTNGFDSCTLFPHQAIEAGWLANRSGVNKLSGPIHPEGHGAKRCPRPQVRRGENVVALACWPRRIEDSLPRDRHAKLERRQWWRHGVNELGGVAALVS